MSINSTYECIGKCILFRSISWKLWVIFRMRTNLHIHNLTGYGPWKLNVDRKVCFMYIYPHVHSRIWRFSYIRLSVNWQISFEWKRNLPVLRHILKRKFGWIRRCLNCQSFGYFMIIRDGLGSWKYLSKQSALREESWRGQTVHSQLNFHWRSLHFWNHKISSHSQSYQT